MARDHELRTQWISGWSRRAGRCSGPTILQIWPTRNTSRPSDTVSRELAGGLSRSLIGESHDQRRVEWAVQ
jgi:hypothetical protein